MKIFKLTPKIIPSIENPAGNKIMGLAVRIVNGDIGSSETTHTYCIIFHREVTEGEETRIEPFYETNVIATQAATLAILNPQTQYAAVSALAGQKGYELLPENQQ